MSQAENYYRAFAQAATTAQLARFIENQWNKPAYRVTAGLGRLIECVNCELLVRAEWSV